VVNVVGVLTDPPLGVTVIKAPMFFKVLLKYSWALLFATLNTPVAESIDISSFFAELE
jgi:hypothetical protein